MSISLAKRLSRSGNETTAGLVLNILRHMTVIKITQSRLQCCTDTVLVFLGFIDSHNSVFTFK